MRGARSLATPAVLAGFLALSAITFWHVILLRQAMVPTDILQTGDPLWWPPSAHSRTGPHNFLDYDIVTQFFPWTVLSAQALRHGLMPLWNPYSFAGTPFLASLQAGVLYPLNVLLGWLVAPLDILGVRAIIHLFLTLAGTYLFARRRLLSRPGAIVAALAFGLGQPVFVWAPATLSVAVTWIPWMLLCVDGAVATRGSPRWLVAAAGTVALELLAGHGETAALAVALCTAYGLFRTWHAWRDEHRLADVALPLLALAAALLLGVGLAAAQVLPTMEQLAHSSTAADRGLSAQAAAVSALGDSTSWITLPAAVIPNMFGNPTWKIALLPLDLNYYESALYIGTIPLFLAVLAVVRRRSTYTIFFALVALISLGIALHLPILGLFNNLPVLRVTNTKRLHVEYAFAMAMLAGYGLDILLPLSKNVIPWRLLRMWAAGVMAMSPIVIAVLLQVRIDGQPIPPTTVVLVAAPVLWCAAFIVSLLLCRRGRLTISAARWLAVALVGVDLMTLDVGFHTTVPAAQALVTPPAVKVVQRDHSLYRVAGLGNTVIPDVSSLYDLQDVRGYDPAYSAAYERYFAASFGSSGPAPGIASTEPSPAAARALALMNVRYIFALCGVQLNTHLYRPVYRGAGCVYRNAMAMPRALVVHSIQWAGPERAVALLSRGAVDPHSTVLLDSSAVRLATWAMMPSAAARRGGWVHVTRYDLNRVDLIVHSAANGVLVLGDAYAPGWHALVDGRSVPVLRANAVFRAVPIGFGLHQVTFTYEPESFIVGRTISAASLVLWALLGAIALWRGRRRLRDSKDAVRVERSA